MKAGRRLIDEGIALVKQQRYDDAIARYRLALRLAPELAEAALYNIGELLVWQGRAGEAIIEYRQALRTAPHSAKLHTGLANALFSQKKFDEANQHYDAASRIDPDTTMRSGHQRKSLRQLRAQ